MAEQCDIFEDLKSIIGCAYISDMRYTPYSDVAKAVVPELRLEKYRLKQLSDLAEYLYGKKTSFSSYEAVKNFFRSVVKHNKSS